MIKTILKEYRDALQDRYIAAAVLAVALGTLVVLSTVGHVLYVILVAAILVVGAAAPLLALCESLYFEYEDSGKVTLARTHQPKKEVDHGEEREAAGADGSK